MTWFFLFDSIDSVVDDDDDDDEEEEFENRIRVLIWNTGQQFK